MKKLVLIAALATVFASQAFAQAYDPDEGTGNIVNPGQAETTDGQYGVGTGAYSSGPILPDSSAPRRVRRAQKMQMN